MTALLLALQFLTRLPVRVSADSERYQGRALMLFPVVGALLGGIGAALDLVLRPRLGAGVTAVFVVAAWIIITGALHWDGLIDSCDGLFTFKTPAERLEVMRDPRAGSFGVLSAVLCAALQIAAIASLSDGLRPIILLLAPTCGRAAIILIMALFPYGRPESYSRSWKTSLRLPHTFVAIVIPLILGTALLGPAGLGLTAAMAGVAVAVGQYAMRKLPGLTGDIYGAACEIVTAACLVGGVLLTR